MSTNSLFECHELDSTARNISRSSDSEPWADFLSYSLHSTNLSETRVSEWSVKSKCQSFLSSTLQVLACKCPRGQMNLSPPLSFSYPAATLSPKPGRKCHIKPLCLWQRGKKSTIYTNKLTHRHTHTDRALVDSHKYLSRCNFPPTSYKTLSLLQSRCDRCPRSCPSASFSVSVQWQHAVLTLSAHFIQPNNA